MTDKEQAKKDIGMCREAENKLIESIEPFMGYYQVVHKAKQQIKILAKQRRHLEKQLREE